MKTVIILLTFLALSFSAHSEDHSLGSFIGTDIDLKAYDHSFAGAIRDFTAFGWVDEATFTSHLTIRKYGKTTVAKFSKSEKGIGGVITTEGSSVAIAFQGFETQGENKLIVYNVNGDIVKVKITSEDIVNDHYVNPTYSTVINAKEYSYRLEGLACNGLSLHYNMMIIAALLF